MRPKRSLEASDFPRVTDEQVDKLLDKTLTTLRQWAYGETTEEVLRRVFEKYDKALHVLILYEWEDEKKAAPVVDEMHPNGRCTCCGEGTCDWCNRTAELLAKPKKKRKPRLKRIEAPQVQTGMANRIFRLPRKDQ